MDEYEITPRNMYNIDKKGFLIRRLIKARRIFNKNLKRLGKLARVR